MNHETKEQAAREWANSNTVEITESYAWQRAKFGFIAGASWLEQQAASGFDDWWSSVYHESVEWRDWQSCDNLHDNKHNMEKAWQASALHSAKLLAEKDAEIERLKLHDIVGYQEGIDCLTKELSQAKELIKVMLVVLWSDNPKQWHRENAEKIKALLGEE